MKQTKLLLLLAVILSSIMGGCKKNYTEVNLDSDSPELQVLKERFKIIERAKSYYKEHYVAPSAKIEDVSNAGSYENSTPNWDEAYIGVVGDKGDVVIVPLHYDSKIIFKQSNNVALPINEAKRLWMDETSTGVFTMEEVTTLQIDKASSATPISKELIIVKDLVDNTEDVFIKDVTNMEPASLSRNPDNNIGADCELWGMYYSVTDIVTGATISETLLYYVKVCPKGGGSGGGSSAPADPADTPPDYTPSEGHKLKTWFVGIAFKMKKITIPLDPTDILGLGPTQTVDGPDVDYHAEVYANLHLIGKLTNFGWSFDASTKNLGENIKNIVQRSGSPASYTKIYSEMVISPLSVALTHSVKGTISIKNEKDRELKENQVYLASTCF
jgi:hypothetical protein